MNRKNIRTVDPVLSNLAFGYSNPSLVGHELFPRVGVPAKSGKIIKFGKDAFRVINTRRAPGTATKRITIGFADENYSLHSNALDCVVPKEWLAEAALIPGLSFQRSSLEAVMQIELNNLEYEQATLARNPAAYSATNKVSLVGNAKWSDYVNSDPIGDVKAGREAIRKKTGQYPNKMLIPADVNEMLSEHPQMLAKFSNDELKIMTVEHYQKIFQVEKVVIGMSMLINPKNNDNFEDVWAADVVLAVVPKMVTSHATMSFGYNYALDAPGNKHPNVEQFWYDRTIKSHVAGVEYERQSLLTGMDAGYLIQGCI